MGFRFGVRDRGSLGIRVSGLRRFRWIFFFFRSVLFFSFVFEFFVFLRF